MKRLSSLAFILFLLIHVSAHAMGAKKPLPREDKVQYAEAVKEHPQMKTMVDEKGFDNLSGKEQWELIGLIDRYAFFMREARYYSGESPAMAYAYLEQVESIRKQLKARFGSVLKE
jgi:hypothetical protein